MSTLSSANVTDVNLVLKERTHMRLCIGMLIFTHNLGNWLIVLIAQPNASPVLQISTRHAANAVTVSQYVSERAWQHAVVAY